MINRVKTLCRLQENAPLGAFSLFYWCYIVALGLLLAAWAQPLHIPPWVSWHSEVLAFSAVILTGAWLLYRSQVRQIKFVALPATTGGVVVLLIGVVSTQVMVGQIGFAGDGVALLFYLASCLFALGVGFELGTPQIWGRGEQRTVFCVAKRFATLMLLGGFLSATVALVQGLEVWNNLSWIVRMPTMRRSGANLGQPNQLATLVLFAVASLGYLYESRAIRAFVATPLMAILLLGVAVTESRTGALGLLLLAGWWYLKRQKVNFALSRRFLVLWLAFFAVCFWFWPAFLNFLQMGSVGDLVATQVNTSAGTRLVVWPQLWQAVGMHPWFGWGLGSVSAAHNAVLDGYTKGEPFTYAHNIFLDLAVGVGLPLTLFLGAVVGVWLWRRVRNTNDTLSWYCLALALPFGVHSMLEFPFAYAYLLVPVVFLLGVLEARLEPERVMRIPWRIATTGWLVVSAAMAWSVYEYIMIEEDFRVVRFEAMHIGQIPSDYERPKVHLLTQLEALLDAGRIVPAPNMAPERVELARKVALRFPWTATQNRYALSLALNGNPDEALRQLKVMRAMHGEKAYQSIKANWSELADSRYPQLKALTLP